MKHQHLSTWALTALLALAGVAGCDVGSSGTSENAIGLNVGGTYTGVSGARLVSLNSGAAVTSLTVSQSGDRLQAVDNLNLVYRGTLAANGAFRLHGSGPAGVEIEMSGVISVSGTRGWMRGYWVEPAVTGVINGLATVPPQPTSAAVTAAAASGGAATGSSGGTSGTGSGSGTAGGSTATGTGGTSTDTGSGGSSDGTSTGGGRTPPMPPPPPGF